MRAAAMLSTLPFAVGTVNGHDNYCETKYQKHLESFPREFFNTVDYTNRLANFCATLHEVETHNSLNGAWTMGNNAFSDWTENEVSILFGAKESNTTSVVASRLPEWKPKGELDVGTAVDWRSKMPGVKNQGHCGSCWAFSAVAVLDFFGGSHSEQELLDCSGGTCKGFMASSALQWLANGHGEETESQYPYQGVQMECHASGGAMKVSSVSTIPGGETRIRMAVNRQVVSVAIKIDPNSAFMKYKSGVYDTDCGTKEGHALAIVGYSDDYWIVRNSWGASWGQGGYIYMKKGNDLCSIESWAPVTADATALVV